MEEKTNEKEILNKIEEKTNDEVIIKIEEAEKQNDEKKKTNNNEIKYEDGKKYIGEINNDLPNGKGTLYNKDNVILYEGDFIDGKKEGNGALYFEEGNYYKGEFKIEKW